jgi:hypothetical protein
LKKHWSSPSVPLAGEPWIVHSQNIYTTIHIAGAREGNEEDPLVISKTRLKVEKGWLKIPKEEVAGYMSNWTTSNFFEKPYDWCKQLSLYETQKVCPKHKKLFMMPFARIKLPKSPQSSLYCQRSHPAQRKGEIDFFEKDLPAARPRNDLNSLSLLLSMPSSPSNRGWTRLPSVTVPSLPKKTSVM